MPVVRAGSAGTRTNKKAALLCAAFLLGFSKPFYIDTLQKSRLFCKVDIKNNCQKTKWLLKVPFICAVQQQLSPQLSRGLKLQPLCFVLQQAQQNPDLLPE